MIECWEEDQLATGLHCICIACFFYPPICPSLIPLFSKWMMPIHILFGQAIQNVDEGKKWVNVT
jgi:hypothetical protein